MRWIVIKHSVYDAANAYPLLILKHAN